MNFISSILLINGILFQSSLQQSNPVFTKWIKSTGVGYNGIINNVQSVQNTTSYVYVHSSSIPSYSIGPWVSNPNIPTNQNFNFKYPLNPTVATIKTSAGNGPIGAWINGVAFYNPGDAQSYKNLGVWNRNAYIWEGLDFDSCNGHASPDGAYHTHINPVCLYNSTNNSTHSPLLGFAFDGFPVYGPFAYSSANDSSSSILRMTSSYTYRNITKRNTLLNGVTLSTYQQGPDVSINSSDIYRIGSFIEDYQYSQGSGTLDMYNGRFCVTPDYPNGTYAYFVTTDITGSPTYPYIIGPSYYGNAGNTTTTGFLSKKIIWIWIFIFISSRHIFQ